MKIYPVTKNLVWGGSKLKKFFNKSSNTDNIAETWELSVHADGMSTVQDGSTLKQILDINPKWLGTLNLNGIQIIVKLIDAADNLSIQVHPDDVYARQFGQLGKRECWYIVDAEDGAGIYCGFNKDLTKQELEQALVDKTILTKLNFISVKKGDSFFIESGTVHAIGKGVTICEIQQSSNITYRLYDYDRRDANNNPRDLHINQSLDVCNLKAYIPKKISISIDDNLLWYAGCKDFGAYQLRVDGEYIYTTLETSFCSFTVIDGQCIINGEDCNTGQTYFAKASNEYTILGKCTIIIATIDKYTVQITEDNKTTKATITNTVGKTLTTVSIQQPLNNNTKEKLLTMCAVNLNMKVDDFSEKQ
ncbi:MAG: class I mannose-6-phosphate isomerase [Firmicutes bacterium]|nr:class I mannose-6-phosphate isomerase [Bacillota bacterium]MCL1954108.1 class I mannose-6-phosphate isomerase [Bacillota bacterium]